MSPEGPRGQPCPLPAGPPSSRQAKNTEIAILRLPTSHEGPLDNGTCSTASVHPLIPSSAIHGGKNNHIFKVEKSVLLGTFVLRVISFFPLSVLSIFVRKGIYETISMCDESAQSDKNVTFHYELFLPRVPSFPSGISPQTNKQKNSPT